MQEIINTLFACVFLTAPWLCDWEPARVDLLLSASPRKVLILVERAIDVFGCVIRIAMAWFTWVNPANSRMFGQC